LAAGDGDADDNSDDDSNDDAEADATDEDDDDADADDDTGDDVDDDTVEAMPAFSIGLIARANSDSTLLRCTPTIRSILRAPSPTATSESVATSNKCMHGCTPEAQSSSRASWPSTRPSGMNILFTEMAETSGVCVDKSVSEPLSGLCCSGEVHPTAAGYLRMASAFALSIAEGPPLV
jgi:hypothetical protein